jgi:PPOX class probable F420-dependent enzyme
MTAQIPEAFAALLTREKKAFASLALVLSDGTPQVTPIWFDWDGQAIILNTARGRVKDKVMRRRPVVALTIVDPADPYRYIQIKGRVLSDTEEGGYEMICSLSEKYRGVRDYPKRPGEVRVTFRINPEKIQTMG